MKSRAVPAAVAAGMLLAGSASAQVATDANGRVSWNPPADAPVPGFGVMGVRQISRSTGGTGDILSQDAARDLLQSPPAGWVIADGTRSYLNISENRYFSTQSTGGTAPDQNFLDPPGSPGIPTDRIVLLANGIIHIPEGQGGVHTFGVSSDDGFTLHFPGNPFTATSGTGTQSRDRTATSTPPRSADAAPDGTVTVITPQDPAGSVALTYYGGRGIGNDTFGQVNLAAGYHPFQLTYHENTGGQGIEFYAARGAHTSFNGNFNLVGAPAVAAEPAVTARRYAGNWSAANSFDVIHLQKTDQATAHASTDPSFSITNAFAAYQALRTADPANDPSAVPGYSIARAAGVDQIRYGDPQAQGNNRGANAAFPQNTTAADNYMALGARGTFSITEDGVYTFGTRSDDSTQFRILDDAGVPVALFDAPNGSGGTVTGVDTPADGSTTGDSVNDAVRYVGANNDAFGRWDLDAGAYTIELVWQEGTGDAHVSLFGAQGNLRTFDNRFQYLGENFDDTATVTPAVVAREAGLALVPEPAGLGVLSVVAAVGLLARRRRGAFGA